MPPAHPWQRFGCWRLGAAADGWRGRVVALHTIRATCAPPGCWQELCVRCACRAACVPARASWGGCTRRSWGARRGPSPLPPAFPGTAGKKKHKKVLERGRSAPTAAPKGSPHNAHGAEFPPGGQGPSSSHSQEPAVGSSARPALPTAGGPTEPRGGHVPTALPAPQGTRPRCGHPVSTGAAGSTLWAARCSDSSWSPWLPGAACGRCLCAVHY